MTYEILNMEQLDKISGGTFAETAADAALLKYLKKGKLEGKLIKKDYGMPSAVFHWDKVSNEVDKAWEKLGIRCITKPFRDNDYFDTTTQTSVTRKEAHALANKRI